MANLMIGPASGNDQDLTRFDLPGILDLGIGGQESRQRLRSP